MDQNRLNLFRLLLAKSIAETILVGTLAVGFFLTAFPPYFHGWGEAAPDGVSGWVVDNSKPWERVQVQLFIDGQFVAHGVANLSRPDVLAAGWSKDEWHGYAFKLSGLSQGLHEARVFAIHQGGGASRQTLQLVGDPIRFSVDKEGKFRDLD